MKLKLTFAIAIIAAVSLTSCKKEYTCTCIDTKTNEEFLTSTFESKSKAAGKIACDAFEIDNETECTLK